MEFPLRYSVQREEREEPKSTPANAPVIPAGADTIVYLEPLGGLNVSYWNPVSATDMSYMFCGCKSLYGKLNVEMMPKSIRHNTEIRIPAVIHILILVSCYNSDRIISAVGDNNLR